MHYRHIGNHAEDTAEGAVLAPGESTEGLGAFDPQNPHNKRLIDEGILAPIPDEPEAEKKKEVKS
jgi:hypothetical protein